MHTFAVVTLTFAISASNSLASDNAAVVTFAKANADKFKSEIAASGSPTVGSTVTVRGSYDAISLMRKIGEYDQTNGMAELSSTYTNFQSLAIAETCQAGASFVGQNAFGAKATIRRESCERVIVFGNNSAKVVGKTLKMSPQQYRQIKKNGVDAEWDLTIDANAKGVPVVYSESTSDATINYPTKTHMRVWFVYGRIDAVRWILPGDAEPVDLWKRAK